MTGLGTLREDIGHSFGIGVLLGKESMMEKKRISLAGGEENILGEGARIFLKQYGYEWTEKENKPDWLVTEKFVKEKKLKVKKRGRECVIFCQEKAHFYRGLSLFLQNISKEEFEIKEKVNFHSNGMMMDCSRNGVPTVDTIKQYVVRMASLGMNRLYLYMEDTLEIQGYPFWGYLRGRYSKEEMQECDGFASLFGITLVPCIQTLAHLRTALHLPAFADYKDIDDILLLEEEKTKALLSGLIKTVSECFSGGIVHLGMDEAAHLGRGKYMDLHGPEKGAKLMKKHLEWLMEECQKRGLEAMIWSDMYLRLNFGAEDYYGIDKDALPEGEENLSKEVGLCYWDYYNEGKEFYKNYIRLHQRLGNPLLFAGGAWTWNGVAPCVSRAMKISYDALDACMETGTEDVFVTAWMDNGAETPLQTVLPLLLLYGEYGFGERPDRERLEERFAFCFGKGLEQYRLLDAFDNPGYEVCCAPDTCDNPMYYNKYSVNPSKTFLYQDNLMGLFEKMYDGEKMGGQYSLLGKELDAILSGQDGLEEEDKGLFGYYHVLAELLSIKAGVGGRIREAYRNGNRERLKELAENDLKKIAALAQGLNRRREEIWMKEYKPFGYEVLDIRLAGVGQRALSAAHRVQLFLSGSIPRIPELEEEILPYKTKEMLEGDFQHGFYLWERIVTAGNIDGV